MPTDLKATEARVIVKFRADSPTETQPSRAFTPQSARAQHLSASLRQVLTAGRMVGPHTQVMRASTLTSQALADQLSAVPEVEYAVVDHVRFPLSSTLPGVATIPPNDPLYQQSNNPAVGQWYLRAPAGAVVSSIDAMTAWRVSTGLNANSQPQIVAVIDSGVRPDHPDLVDKLLPGYDMIGDDSESGVASYITANDGTGRDNDAADPGDGLTQADIDAHPQIFPQPLCPVSDSTWHGTEVSGLVGAEANNGIGIAGLGWFTKVLPVRVLGRCGGYDSDIIAGMRWAAGLPHGDDPRDSTVPTNPNPARILNLSLGGPGPCEASYQDVMSALTAQNVLVVIAAGNSYGGSVNTPARCSGVLAVGGVDHSGYKAAYTDLGPEVALSAPSGDVPVNGVSAYPMVTTSNSGVLGPSASIYTSSTVRPSFGTSFSTPLVAATAALLLAKEPTLTPDELSHLMTRTTRAFPGVIAGHNACVDPASNASLGAQAGCACTSTTCGSGMLDAGAALTLLDEGFARIEATPAAPSVNQSVSLKATMLGQALPNTYSWRVLNSSGDPLPTLLNSNAQTATFTPVTAGTVTVELTVVDTLNRIHANTKTLTISPPLPSSGGGYSSGLFLGLLGLAGIGALGLRWRPKGGGSMLG